MPRPISLACCRAVLFALLLMLSALPATGAQPLADGPPEGFPAPPAHAAAPVPRSGTSRDSVALLPVSFQFAQREEGHELLLTDVHVTIDDTGAQGRVLSAVSDGPFLQATVPEGCYQVTATHAGRAQVAVIVVERSEPLLVAFYW